MVLEIFLQVLSWEERARILSKVWIIGIAVSLLAVFIFLRVQYLNQKKRKALSDKRGRTPKSKSPEVVSFYLESYRELDSEVLKKLSLDTTTKKNIRVAYSEKGGLILAALSIEETGVQKLTIQDHQLLNHEDQRALHWVLKRLVLGARKNQYASIQYLVSDKSDNDFLDMLESFGFKRIGLGKKEKDHFNYALKYHL